MKPTFKNLCISIAIGTTIGVMISTPENGVKLDKATDKFIAYFAQSKLQNDACIEKVSLTSYSRDMATFDRFVNCR